MVYLKQILKQTFVIIITYVLVFAISIPCFADDVKTSPAGFNSWTTQEKFNYLGNTAAQIISSVTGLVSGSGGDGLLNDAPFLAGHSTKGASGNPVIYVLLLLATLPPLIVYILFSKNIMGPIVLGAVKG